MPMPETPMNKDNRPVTWQNNIWSTREFFPVESKAVAHAV